MRWFNGTGSIDTITVNDPFIGHSTFIRFWNPGGTFTYSIITSAIAGNRNIILPLLIGHDTFVFESHAQTLANKTLTEPVINGSGGQLTLPAGPDTFVGRATNDTLSNKTLTTPTINTPTITSPTINTSIVLDDATNIALNTTTGTIIGTATNQKLGFYNATPVTQRTGIANVATDTVDGTYGAEEQAVIESLRTKLNVVLQVLEDLGLTAVA